MRENESVLLVLSVCDGEIILEKSEILSEKRHVRKQDSSIFHLVNINPRFALFLSNPLAKANAIAEYSPISLEQTGLCVGFTRN